MAFLRIVGDVHQVYNPYLKLLEGCEHSVQVGDLGFNYGFLEDQLRWGHDVFFPGNHDNYDKDSDNFWQKQDFALGNYGHHYISDWKPIFYVRGGYSIDQQHRTHGVDWWPEEQLSYEQLSKAVYQYKINKPDIVLTHECPLEIVKHVTDPDFVRRFGFTESVIQTRTNQALQRMFDIHKPKLWVFGHYHKAWRGVVHGTQFVCLDMLRDRQTNKDSYLDLDEMGVLQ